jgi:hypothetical protein
MLQLESDVENWLSIYIRHFVNAFGSNWTQFFTIILDFRAQDSSRRLQAVPLRIRVGHTPFNVALRIQRLNFIARAHRRTLDFDHGPLPPKPARDLPGIQSPALSMASIALA